MSDMQREIGKLIGASLAKHAEVLHAINREQAEIRKLLNVTLSRLGIVNGKLDELGADVDQLANPRRR